MVVSFISKLTTEQVKEPLQWIALYSAAHTATLVSELMPRTLRQRKKLTSHLVEGN